jgi:hypothetical protein
MRVRVNNYTRDEGSSVKHTVLSAAMNRYTDPSSAAAVHSGDVRRSASFERLTSPRMKRSRVRVLRAIQGMSRCSSRGLLLRSVSCHRAGKDGHGYGTHRERSAVCRSSQQAETAIVEATVEAMMVCGQLNTWAMRGLRS